MANAVQHVEEVLGRRKLEQPIAKLRLVPAPRLREQSRRLDLETQGARRSPLCGRAGRVRASDFRLLVQSASLQCGQWVFPSHGATFDGHRAALESHGCHSAPAGLAAEQGRNSLKWLSRNSPVARSITSIRLCPRSTGGSCAISSSGSSKSKSATRRSAHDACCPRCARGSQPRAFDSVVQLLPFGFELLSRKSDGTRVHCAQLTMIRVKGLGIRKRSHNSRSRRVPAGGGRRHRRARRLRQFDRPHLGFVDWSARPIRGEDRRASGLDHTA